jgi:hypothetical protein
MFKTSTIIACSVLASLGTAGGCAKSTVLLEELGDGGRLDGSTVAPEGSTPDASIPEDAGAEEPGAMDAGRNAEERDAGVMLRPGRLMRALHCDLDDEAALRAIARHVACDPDTRGTVRSYYEAWEAGLFGTFEPGLELFLGYRVSYGCPAWRCMASAASCEEHAACIDDAQSAARCDPEERRCDGGVIEECVGSGDGFVPVFDCGVVDAACVNGACRTDEGCEFGRRPEELACSGDALVLCDLAVSCPLNWQEGTSCASFLVGGELPTMWCSGEGDQAGGYTSAPIRCAGGTIELESVSGARRTFDCRSQGYSGCDASGCVL